ncbi:MAG: hypothetical protein V4649_10140 [Bacteroidota bacterium]
MAQLSDEQLAAIEQLVRQEGVNEDLQNNLLDHYCCYIEEQIDNGLDFYVAYQNAIAAISPNGVGEIQEELFFLLTFKMQTNMKRVIYGFGFFAAFLISMSLLFRIMHWPGVVVLHVSGFAALIVASTAIFINAMKHKDRHSPMYNLRVVAGFVAGMLIAIGSIFKMLHYPGANVQILLGMLALNFVYLPMFFYHLYKKSLAQQQPK